MRDLWQRRRTDVIGVALATGLAALLFAYNLSGVHPRRYAASCQSNLKQIGLAYMQYARDYDEKFPLASNWAEGLWPYSKNLTLFQCPAHVGLTNSYAMNRRAAALTLTEMYEPRVSVVTFESDANQRNAIDFGTSLPAAARHPLGHSILFGDAHVEWANKPDFARGYDPLIALPIRRQQLREEAKGWREYYERQRHDRALQKLRIQKTNAGKAKR